MPRLAGVPARNSRIHGYHMPHDDPGASVYRDLCSECLPVYPDVPPMLPSRTRHLLLSQPVITSETCCICYEPISSLPAPGEVWGSDRVGILDYQQEGPGSRDRRWGALCRRKGHSSARLYRRPFSGNTPMTLGRSCLTAACAILLFCGSPASFCDSSRISTPHRRQALSPTVYSVFSDARPTTEYIRHLFAVQTDVSSPMSAQ
ncbi:hypothetical protein C8Q77DRAFT_446343 [Trametes polyzona]|nr:hypothetical protein C8Q77DRAFT_446343 [Trametes polyzona]